MRKYILIKSPVEPQGIPNLENYIWLKYTPTDETEEVSPLEDGYYIWLGMWFKLPFVNGYIDKSLIPEEYITNEELQALTASIDELIDTKSTVVAPMYLNLSDATITPYTPHGGTWNKTAKRVDGDVESVLSNGETRYWSNDNSDYIDGYYTWFTIATFEKGGRRIVDWMTPICIRIAKDGKDGEDGIDGTNGKDSMSHSFIYKLLSKSQAASGNFDPYYPSSNDKTRWDFVPAGWTASPSGISEENPIELVCFRIYDPSIELWSDFVGPRIWSQWGQSGKDGDGVEYIYRLARIEGESAEAYYDNGTDTYHLYEDYWPTESIQDDDYIPEGWTDDPADVSANWPVQFVSKRKYDGETKTWGEYTEPVCWNKLPLADVAVTAFTSFVFTVSSIEGLERAELVGGSVHDPEPERTILDGVEQDVTWYDTIPSDTNGSVWMATCTFVDGESNGWSHPKKLVDDTDFQVEYSDDYPWTDNPRPVLPNFGLYSSEASWRTAAENAGCGYWNDDDTVNDPSFMATCQLKNGVWSDWVVSKIKGENGMSPIVITNDNPMAPITVNENNQAWILSFHEINLTAELGAELLDITRVEAAPKDGGVFPSGISRSVSIPQDHKSCTVTIAVNANTILKASLPITITLYGEGYSQSTTFTLVPITSTDGCSYKISINDSKIDRDINTGNYTPSMLKCEGLISIGTGPFTKFGTLKYSATTITSDPILNIGDTYDNQAGINDFPSNGELAISSISGHINLKRIYVYLLRNDNKVVDVTYCEIGNTGTYEIILSEDMGNVKGSTLTPTKLKVSVVYKETTMSPGGTSVTTNKLWYKINDVNTWYAYPATIGTEVYTWTNLVSGHGITVENLNKITFAYSSSTSTSITVEENLLAAEKEFHVLHTKDGTDGTDGTDGVGIASVYDYYLTVEPPFTETQIKNAPIVDSPTQDEYNKWLKERAVNVDENHPALWKKTKTTYTDTPATITWGAAYKIRDYIDIDTSDIEDAVTNAIEESITSGDLKTSITDVISEGIKDDGSNLSAAVITATQDNITQAVTKGHYCWLALEDGQTTTGYSIVKDSRYTYGSSESGVTKKNDNEDFDDYETRILAIKCNNRTAFQRKLILDEMSAIEQDSHKISMLVTENGTVSAALQILGAASTDNPTPGVSRVVLTASNILLNGEVLAKSIEAGRLSVNNGKCIIETDGTLKATGATITGIITASSGKIGNLTINNDGSLTNGNFTLSAIGKLTASDVDLTGKITASSGSIGALNIAANGSLTNSAGTFSLLADGTLSLTGAIRATSGQISGDLIISPNRTIPVVSVDLSDVQGIGKIMEILKDGVINYDNIRYYLHIFGHKTPATLDNYTFSTVPTKDQAKRYLLVNYNVVTVEDYFDWFTHRHTGKIIESTETVSTTVAGLSGTINSDVLAWFGGTKTTATTIFNADGSGYVAGGKFTWDANGNVSIENCEINRTTNKFKTLASTYTSKDQIINDPNAPIIEYDNCIINDSSKYWLLPEANTCQGRTITIRGLGHIVSKSPIKSYGVVEPSLYIYNEIVEIMAMDTYWCVLNRQSTRSDTLAGFPMNVMCFGHFDNNSSSNSYITSRFLKSDISDITDIGNPPANAYGSSSKYMHFYKNDSYIYVDFSPSFFYDYTKIFVLATPKVYGNTSSWTTKTVDSMVYSATNSNNKQCYRVCLRTSETMSLDFMIANLWQW